MADEESRVERLLSVLKQRTLRQELLAVRDGYLADLKNVHHDSMLDEFRGILERHRPTRLFRDVVLPKLAKPHPVTSIDLADAFLQQILLRKGNIPFDEAYVDFERAVFAMADVDRTSDPIPTLTFSSPLKKGDFWIFRRRWRGRGLVSGDLWGGLEIVRGRISDATVLPGR